jgi:hypothetical protein
VQAQASDRDDTGGDRLSVEVVVADAVLDLGEGHHPVVDGSPSIQWATRGSDRTVRSQRLVSRRPKRARSWATVTRTTLQVPLSAGRVTLVRVPSG